MIDQQTERDVLRAGLERAERYLDTTVSTLIHGTVEHTKTQCLEDAQKLRAIVREELMLADVARVTNRLQGPSPKPYNPWHFELDGPVQIIAFDALVIGTAIAAYFIGRLP